GFPALFFASAIVLRIASRPAIGMGDVEHGFFAPIIVQGCHPVGTAVHDRMLAGQVAPELAQNLCKLFTRVGSVRRRRGGILRQPFSQAGAGSFGADVPQFLAPIPFGAGGFGRFAFRVRNRQILPFLLVHEILFATLLRCASSVAICLWPCATVHLIPFWVCDPSCRMHVCFRFSLFRCWLAYLL